jgi:hypothetical protein
MTSKEDPMNDSIPTVGDPDLDWALRFPQEIADLNQFEPKEYFAYLGGVWSGIVSAQVSPHHIAHDEWSIGYFHAMEHVRKAGLRGKIPAVFDSALLRSLFQHGPSNPGDTASGQAPR